MRKKATIFVVLAFLLVLGAAPAYAVPALPHAFYGSVTVNGAAAPDGTHQRSKPGYHCGRQLWYR